MDHFPLTDSQPQQSEKICAALASPTTPLLLMKAPSSQDDVSQTFIVDLASLGNPSGVPGKSPKDGCMSAPSDELRLDNSPSAPSPHELLENSPHLPLSVDVPSAELPLDTDAESVDTPIKPPGLLGPVNDAAAEAHEPPAAQPAVEDVDIGRAPSPCFSLSGLETLHTFIPDDLLPDDLLVYDPDKIIRSLDGDTAPESPKADKHVRYVRVFPRAPESRKPAPAETSPAAGDTDCPQEARVSARLYLKKSNVLGSGHHSSVYSAPLRLRLDAGSGEESIVRVGVKTASAQCGAHEMLRREALAYKAFPRHLMEDRYPATEPPQTVASPPADSAAPDGAAHLETGDVDGTCSTAGVPTSTADDASTDPTGTVGDECTQGTHTPRHEPAVVPKFFGYYAAVDADGSVIKNYHPDCYKDDTCPVSWPTRLLLVEECGKPIVLEERPLEQRTGCLELFKRLHAAGFMQGSIYARNIVVQPGPLSAPHDERSDDTPSFRIIDFGRMRMRTSYSDNEERFAKLCAEEEDWAHDVLINLHET